MKKANENATIIPAYKSYGVLAHEKRPFYSVCAPASEIYDKINLAIPAEFEVFETVSGMPAVVINGQKYLVNEILTNYGEKPALVYVGDDNKSHRIMLHIAE